MLYNQLALTLKMTTAQGFETSVTVNNKSPTLTSTPRGSSTPNPFGSTSSYARPSGLQSGDPS